MLGDNGCGAYSAQPSSPSREMIPPCRMFVERLRRSRFRLEEDTLIITFDGDRRVESPAELWKPLPLRLTTPSLAAVHECNKSAQYGNVEYIRLTFVNVHIIVGHGGKYEGRVRLEDVQTRTVLAAMSARCLPVEYVRRLRLALFTLASRPPDYRCRCLCNTIDASDTWCSCDGTRCECMFSLNLL